MSYHFHKYHGAGNDFILIDDRNLDFPSYDNGLISQMCHRRFGIGADGLILLQNHNDFDFEMKYFNADGFEGSMCGNGGRCIVQYAKDLNIIVDTCSFMTVDGLHQAEISSNGVKLSMSNVNGYKKIESDYFIETGSPHLVLIREKIAEIDVINEGRKLRYDKSIASNGCNVNFIEQTDINTVAIRTYERGVENETWACGTGAVASAITFAIKHNMPDGACSIKMLTKGGNLVVDFIKSEAKFSNVYLSGSAMFIYTGEYK